MKGFMKHNDDTPKLGFTDLRVVLLALAIVLLIPSLATAHGEHPEEEEAQQEENQGQEAGAPTGASDDGTVGGNAAAGSGGTGTTGTTGTGTTVTTVPKPVCGDGICNGTETPFTCGDDCPPVCGDNICSPGENCPGDCNLSETCGDTVCDWDEDFITCPSDCADGCGDAECLAPETATSCPTDCGDLGSPPVCGDSACHETEDPVSCPADCGTPALFPSPPPPPPPVCGDGTCALGENPCNCTADCGPVGDPAACACGDAVCDAGIGEDCASCATDCGECIPPPTGNCGDGVCEGGAGETCLTCEPDCGVCNVLDDQSISPPPDDPADQDDGLDPAFQKHWEMNLAGEEYTVPIGDTPQFEVANPLTDGEGRRDVVYRPLGSGGGEVLNTPDTWNFWAGGIESNGLTLVCWNRLTGRSSIATVGTMPDPREGVQLVCVTNDGAGWTPEVIVESGQPAAWILDFEINPQGEPTVVYYRDTFGTFINTGQTGDAVYEASFQ